jgi:hypothetical protein
LASALEVPTTLECTVDKEEDEDDDDGEGAAPPDPRPPAAAADEAAAATTVSGRRGRLPLQHGKDVRVASSQRTEL